MDGMEEVVQEFLAESTEALDKMDNDLIALEAEPSNRGLIAGIFRTIHTIKGTCGFLGFAKLESVSHVGENLLGQLREGELDLDPDITTGLLAMVDAVRKMLSAVESTGQDGDQDYAELVETLTRLKEGSSKADPAGDAGGNAAPASAKTSDTATPALAENTVERQNAPSVAETSIRVDVDLLDKLMNLVGELLLARNQIQRYVSSHRDPVFVNATQRLNLITSELQLGVMKTRMQPISNIWNKFPRVVRDLSMKCGKQVRIEMNGKETELDKSLIEAMKDPLTHLLRNSVDHGIETPAERKEKGKPPEGCLSLHAYHESGQVIIEIADDGAGINIERVMKKAFEQDIITREQALQMSDREIAKLIFLPGFSTAQKVSNVSGRGVGMDVVKTNIEKINGQIDLDTDPEIGTRFRIQLPLTLAITPALIVRSGGEQFAIPQTALQELVSVDAKAAKTGIETIHGAPVFRLRGTLLPLVSLNQILQLNGDAAGSEETVNIVVLYAGRTQFGLVVDAVEDTQEIVVKPLSKIIKSAAEFAGATIMGDGAVSLILDVISLAQRARVISDKQGETLNGSRRASETTADTERRTYVVTRMPGGGRMAIPLDMVTRLEEFRTDSLEQAGDHLVVQYRGEVMPLINLADLLGERRGRPREESGVPEQAASDHLSAIVYNVEGHSVGLVVDSILDIVEDSFTVKGNITRRGVTGTIVIQGNVAEVLDADAVIGDIVSELGEQYLLSGTAG